jgi:penicillin-binding protein 1A
MVIPGVKTATKTGTSDKGGSAKDIWMMSYSPVLTMGVWLGNSDATILLNGNSSIPGSIIAEVMEYAHKDVYAPQGLWKSGDWYTKPSGIQTVSNELYPAWWNKTQGQTETKLFFDMVSKKKATADTPEAAKVELDVTKSIDPVTKKDIYIAPDGYDGNSDDDVHKSTDITPIATVEWVATSNPNVYTINTSVIAGTFPTITNVQIMVNGSIVTTITNSGPYSYTYTISDTQTTPTTVEASATVMDSGYYANTSATASKLLPAYTAPSEP